VDARTATALETSARKNLTQVTFASAGPAEQHRPSYGAPVPDFETPSGLVYTSRQVMYDGWPILNVTHDADDEHWQFINGWGDTEEGMKPILVHAEHVIELDPTIASLSDLPLGWRAWRADVTDDWTREPDPS
jgi:hypothetical protein